jgi:hypothetical protein
VMGAWRVLLTHFSARYGWRAPPGIWEGSGARDARRAVARAMPMYDGAVVPFDQLHLLPLLSRLIVAGLSADADADADGEQM